MIGDLTLDNFYTSKTWLKFRQIVIGDRLTPEGETICELCCKPIVRAYDIILHHIEELNDNNVNDSVVSLNPANIMLLHHKCHNIVHNKLGHRERGIYLVYGAPLAGKSSYVESVREPGDLVIDIDNIWQCVSDCDRYVKPPRLNAVVFGVKDYLLQCVKYRRGKWNNAYIIGGYPLISERERLCKELGAREVFIDTSKDECMNRLFKLSDDDVRACEDWHNYINDWFEKYIPPL